jgi:glycosyltransferase involved in cell wall biosynthesis
MNVDNINLAVLLPYYINDNLSYFKQTIESLAHQTYSNFTLLILVDGPIKDEASLFIDSLENKNIKVIRFPINRGLCYVLNDGIKYCLENNYKYIARMDADDISIETRLEDQLNFMENNPDIDIVGGAIIEIDENSKPGRTLKYPLTHADCLNFYKKRDPLAHPAVMFRNTFFEKAGFYVPISITANWEDSILWGKGFKNGCVFANLDKPILKFRVNPSFFGKRRNFGLKLASSFFKDKSKIIKELNLGYISYLYLFGYCSVMLAPPFLKKIAYRYFR